MLIDSTFEQTLHLVVAGPRDILSIDGCFARLVSEDEPQGFAKQSAVFSAADAADFFPPAG